MSIFGKIAIQIERNVDMVEYISIANVDTLRSQRKLTEPSNKMCREFHHNMVMSTLRKYKKKDKKSIYSRCLKLKYGRVSLDD